MKEVSFQFYQAYISIIRRKNVSKQIVLVLINIMKEMKMGHKIVNEKGEGIFKVGALKLFSEKRC